MPKPLRAVVLVNEGAGAAEGRQGMAFAAALAAAFERRGAVAETQLLPSDSLREAAERARERVARGEIDAIAVGGGDGSIRTVAGVLADTGIPLGVIPLGTLNHFARDLGLPADLDGAAAVICAGHARVVDAAEVNGELFVNNSSIGIYPSMVQDRERLRQGRGWTKWTAMLVAGLRTLKRFPVRRLSISAEGWTEPCRTSCVFIGNNRYEIEAAAFGRRRRLDCGELCLYVAKPQSRLSLIWLGLRSAVGFLDGERDLRAFTARAAVIDARQHRMLVALDGEVQRLRSPLRYRSRPGALRVFAPPSAEER